MVTKREVKMDEKDLLKDNSEYIVFSCNKCRQYSYVKTTQKTKKCLRCGHLYQVKSLLTSGVIVRGISAALYKVKELQNQLGSPNFRAAQEFVIEPKSRNKDVIQTTKLEPNKLKFLSLLHDLSQKYKLFPLYLIELMANDYNIPKELIAKLISQGLKSKVLLKKGEDQYYVNLH
jgi:hypothetical protein